MISLAPPNRREVVSTLAALAALRDEAGMLGGFVGESCLFFEDLATPGALFVVPLQRLTFSNVRLDAYVLHRYAGGGALSEARPVRDPAFVREPEKAENFETTGFETPSECVEARGDVARREARDALSR